MKQKSKDSITDFFDTLTEDTSTMCNSVPECANCKYTLVTCTSLDKIKANLTGLLDRYYELKEAQHDCT